MNRYDSSHDRCSNLDNSQDSEFTALIEQAMSRRHFLQFSAGGAGAFLAAAPLTMAVAEASKASSKLLGFEAGIRSRAV